MQVRAAKNQAVQSVVIVGGGTAGWMTAAALSTTLRQAGLSITLIESAEIGTVGVGEATVPNIRYFNQMIGLDEVELVARTKATIKLGIEFCDWGKLGDRYIHPFGAFGEVLGDAEFHQYWIRSQIEGMPSDFDEFCYPIVMARQNRFDFPDPLNFTPLTAYSYAFQFDASLYAAFLSEFAQKRGVVRQEGKVVSVEVDAETGFIESVTLESGATFKADLFIDCSGFRGLLIEQCLQTGYDDWSRYLPCNRAIAVPCELSEDVGPYTRATALTAGWQWRIPLQHRIGNGHVYCDAYLDAETAESQLLQRLDGAALADPRHLRFVTGKRRRLWSKNCVAIGLSGGFLEPLESTSIDLIQSGITNLIELFPDRDCSELDSGEYNRVMDLEYDRVRDFLMLHYVANQRDDSDFWRDMRNLEKPDSLAAKIEAFEERGLVPHYAEGLFQPPSWLAVFIGQNVPARAYDPRVDKMSSEMLTAEMSRIRSSLKEQASQIEGHADFLRRILSQSSMVTAD